jgi:hypothetical protein
MPIHRVSTERLSDGRRVCIDADCTPMAVGDASARAEARVADRSTDDDQLIAGFSA